MRQRYIFGPFSLLAIAACGGRGERSTADVAADTVLTPRQTQDTTIIRSDTTVAVDTIAKEGQRPGRPLMRDPVGRYRPPTTEVPKDTTSQPKTTPKP